MFIESKSNGVDQRWEEAVDRLEGAYDVSTRCAYRRNFARFVAWCDSASVPSLPAASHDVAAFLENLASRLKPPSLAHLARNIGRIHCLAREPDPTKSIDVFLALRRATRRNTYTLRQAFGLTMDILRLMDRACADDLAGYRDRALMWIGFETLCPGSEIASLRVDDLKRTSRGTLTVLVRRGKTDQACRGRTVVLSTSTALVVNDWLACAKLEAGLLLPRLDRSLVPAGALAVGSITRILRTRAQEAALPSSVVSQISSHSLRVGGAQ